MKEKVVKEILIGVMISLFLGILITTKILIRFKNTEDIILKEDLTCQFREEVYPKDFIKSLNGKLLSFTPIDTNTVGKKTIQIDYQNQYGYLNRLEIQIEILDVTSPTIVVSNPYRVEKGSIASLEDSIFCADDYDDDVICQIDGSYDLDKVGSYDLKIAARDFSENQTVRKFTLEVVEESKENVSSSKNSSTTSFLEVYQKYKTKNTMIGLDLSKWQGEVDFSKLKEQGVEFVMLKLGGQTEINGEFILDPTFLENIEKATEQNIEVGVYFYSYAVNVNDAMNQAKWVIRQLKGYDITLPVAFDWENWSSFTTFHISFRTLNKIADTFLKEIEKNGYQAMLYSSKYYLENIWYQEEYTNWLAYYTTENTYPYDFYMWQLCSDGRIEGISGNVDIDVLYLS